MRPPHRLHGIPRSDSSARFFAFNGDFSYYLHVLEYDAIMAVLDRLACECCSGESYVTGTTVVPPYDSYAFSFICNPTEEPPTG